MQQLTFKLNLKANSIVYSSGKPRCLVNLLTFPLSVIVGSRVSIRHYVAYIYTLTVVCNLTDGFRQVHRTWCCTSEIVIYFAWHCTIAYSMLRSSGDIRQRAADVTIGFTLQLALHHQAFTFAEWGRPLACP